jgi:GH15 family glucan-1,4-alpha-glucosidase
MNLGVIGNCGYQALIDDRARVRWLCWPRFDSSFVFGSLLDAGKGGEMAIEPARDGFESTQRYERNTNILVTRFRAADAAFEVIDFAPRFQQFERYFKPRMLVRIVRRLAGSPMIRARCRPVYDYGRLEPRRYLASNHIQWELPQASLRLTSNVPLTYIDEERSFLLDTDAYLVLTWGEPLEAPIEETCESFLERTRRYWERWVKHTALPGCFQTEVVRSALALKLHQFEDTGAITAATTTSLPEFPGSGRTWDYRHCWLRDAYFTLHAMRRINHFEETEAFVSFLKNIAESSPERLQPVYGIGGESQLREQELDHLGGYCGNGPVRIGNAAYRQEQNDVYGEMLSVLAPLFLDVRFEELRAARTRALIGRLLERVAETMERPDAGLWEIRDEPKVHTFSLLMQWWGAHVAAHIGARIGDGELEGRARGLAERARGIIERQCWRPALGYYADSTSSDNADAALFMMVNLGFSRAEPDRAASHVERLAERLRARRALFHRYVHDDGIGATHAAFTVCGFWYAEALARLGRREEAERHVADLCLHANALGLFSEDVDPQTGVQWGNFPQTYSHVGLINAAFAIRAAPEDLTEPLWVPPSPSPASSRHGSGSPAPEEGPGTA